VIVLYPIQNIPDEGHYSFRTEAKLNNVDKQTKGLMGFEPPSRTIHSITRQRQCNHDYCAPAFSQVHLLLRAYV
jgi:hypothetical protein